MNIQDEITALNSEVLKLEIELQKLKDSFYGVKYNTNDNKITDTDRIDWLYKNIYSTNYYIMRESDPDLRTLIDLRINKERTKK